MGYEKKAYKTLKKGSVDFGKQVSRNDQPLFLGEPITFLKDLPKKSEKNHWREVELIMEKMRGPQDYT